MLSERTSVVMLPVWLDAKSEQNAITFLPMLYLFIYLQLYPFELLG